MLAIMGPSGAGKTTLLSIISKRNSPSLTINGDVSFFLSRSSQIIVRFPINNFIVLGHSFTKMIFFTKLSLFEVKSFIYAETLEFAAYLKIPSRSFANKVVDLLVSDFELQKC
jgi:ABC-type multidrug transport system ATPase subunit